MNWQQERLSEAFRAQNQLKSRFGYLQVFDTSVGEGQHVDHGLAAHVQRVAALLVVHADVILWFVEVEPGGLCGLKKQKASRR